jgi:hypothetical protein
MTVQVKTTVDLPRLPGFWAPGDSETLGKAHIGRVRVRVREQHLGSDDLAMRPYSGRYNAWKRQYLGGKAAHSVQMARQGLEGKKRPGKKALAALDSATAAFDAVMAQSGPLDVDLTLSDRHLDSLRVVEADKAGWIIEAPAPYAAINEVWRPHLYPSPSDRRALVGIALKIIRARAAKMRRPRGPK